MGESPGGTKIWVPKVDSKICPKVGDVFSSVESVEKMYRKYGDVAGFDIRMGTKKLNSLGGVQTRYFICSKEGNPTKKEFDSLEVSSGDRKRRNTNFKRTGCKACLKVHYVKESGRYEVYHFIEGHNHMLCCSDEKMFTRSRRQLDYKDRRNVYHASSSKVGITQSRRMQLAMNGGLVASGGTARDHMNFRRDIMLFVGNKDAQITTIPKLLSPSKIEAQAAKVYTKTIFFDVQKEMNKAVWFCGVVEVVEVGDKMIYSNTHKNKNSEVKATYKVVHDVRDESFECSCNHFVRNGILCRHAFKVMLNSEVQSIPEKYILPRWRRELVPIELMSARVRYGEMDVEKQALINQAISMFDVIIGRVRNDKGALTEFVNQLEHLGDEISADVPILTVTEQKRNDIEELLCVTEPESVDVLPPTGVRNKGCGTGKRLVGVSERVSMN
ncbi:FAR1 DNA binding domain-containing protein, partial [Cynara cardunculus var. scolymus]